MPPAQRFEDIPITEEGVVLPEYRAVSGLAIAGLLLGLLSVLAFIHPVLWLIPLGAVLACGLALRAIAAQEQTLVGRRAALIGMAVSLVFGISCPIQYFLYRYQLRAEAILTAREWFTAVREDRPFAAHQLTLPPEGRWSLDDAGLVARYAGEPAILKSYVNNSTVRLLLALGKQAHVRYYENIGVVVSADGENVLDVYAVTVTHEGRRISFFLRVSLARTYNLAVNDWQWRISHTEFIQAPPGQWGIEFTRF